MTSERQFPSLRLERAALWLAAVGAIGTIVLGSLFPHDFGIAYRFALFACLGPAVGSLTFVLIYRMTGGGWAEPLLPFFAAGFVLLPWLWLLTALAIFLPPFANEPWPAYASRGMVAIRAVIFAAIFFAMSRAARRADVAWFGPVGLIGLVFMLHVLADDWLATLDPHWHSTAFPIVWVTSAAVAGFSLALLGAAAARRAGDAAYAIDRGNLLFASMLMWCYVAFAQFLIIWSGNLPREIEWFERRVRGGWLVVVVLLALFHFAVPFVCLLSRRLKQSTRALASVAALMLAAQLTYTAWTILPAASTSSLSGLALALALVVAAGGAFFNRYLVVARRAASIA